METEMTNELKLTKSALSAFLKWSTTKYNDWLGYGTKKQAVERVYNAMLAGEDVFEIKCASPVGENGNGRYWKTKAGGENYRVDPKNRTITAEFSQRKIKLSGTTIINTM